MHHCKPMRNENDLFLCLIFLILNSNNSRSSKKKQFCENARNCMERNCTYRQAGIAMKHLPKPKIALFAQTHIFFSFSSSSSYQVIVCAWYGNGSYAQDIMNAVFGCIGKAENFSTLVACLCVCASDEFKIRKKNCYKF